MTTIFSATIQNGKLLVDNPADLRSYLQSLEGKRVELTVEKYKRKRTVDQNRWTGE